MEFILENLGKIGFEWKMALFNLVNFLILFALLKKFFFTRIVDTINKRQKMAKDGVENFQKSESELHMAQQKAQTLIDEGKVAANKLIEKASLDAKATADKLKEKATGDIELLVAQAKKNIDIDKKDMQESLRKETVALVAAATAVVLKEVVTEEVDAKFIESKIKEVKA
jgi:F-type H+-transporting ATPase subunit b